MYVYEYVCMQRHTHTYTPGSASDGPPRPHTAEKVIDLPVSLLPDMRVKRDLLVSKRPDKVIPLPVSLLPDFRSRRK